MRIKVYLEKKTMGRHKCEIDKVSRSFAVKLTCIGHWLHVRKSRYTNLQLGCVH